MKYNICKVCSQCPNFKSMLTERDIEEAAQQYKIIKEKVFFKRLSFCGCYFEKNQYGDIHSGYRCLYRNNTI